MNDIPRAVGGFLNDHPGWAAAWYYGLGFIGGFGLAVGLGIALFAKAPA